MTDATEKIGATAANTSKVAGYWFTGTVRAVMVAVIPLTLVGLVVLLMTSIFRGVSSVVMA